MSRTGTNTPGFGSDDIRRPLDVNELDSEASEYSWGYGLTPQGFENAPPSEGGRYKGQSPPCERHVDVSRR